MGSQHPGEFIAVDHANRPSHNIWADARQFPLATNDSMRLSPLLVNHSALRPALSKGDYRNHAERYDQPRVESALPNARRSRLRGRRHAVQATERGGRFRIPVGRALVTLGVAIGRLVSSGASVQPPPAPTYTDKQVADAKTKVCAAYEKVHCALGFSLARDGGNDPTAHLPSRLVRDRRCCRESLPYDHVF